MKRSAAPEDSEALANRLYNGAMSQVQLARLNEAKNAALEFYEGEMVNEAGYPVEAPTLGSPIFLYIHSPLRKKKVPWTFRTAPVVEITLIDPGFWDVVTNDGQTYSIDPGRVYH
jgi:hypothetical protein